MVYYFVVGEAYFERMLWGCSVTQSPVFWDANGIVSPLGLPARYTIDNWTMNGWDKRFQWKRPGYYRLPPLPKRSFTTRSVQAEDCKVCSQVVEASQQQLSRLTWKPWNTHQECEWLGQSHLTHWSAFNCCWCSKKKAKGKSACSKYVRSGQSVFSLSMYG